MPNPNIFLITGTDSSHIASQAQQLFQQIAGDNPDALAIDVICESEEGPTPELITKTVESLQSPSFWGGNKTVWLKHYTGFELEGDKKTTEPNAVALRSLGEVLKNGLPPDITFIAEGVGMDRRKSLFKLFSDVGQVFFYEKPQIGNKNVEEQMRGYLLEAAKQKGIRLNFQAESYLIDALGTDTDRIDAELEKVICYRGTTQGEISLDEVQQVCTGKGEEAFWALGDVLGKRDIKEMLRVIDTLITQNKNDEQYSRALFFTVNDFFRQAIRIQALMHIRKIGTPVALKNLAQSLSKEEKEALTKEGMEFINLHVFRIQCMAAQATAYTPEELIRAIKILRDALWQMSSSASSPRMLLENSLIQIMARG